MLFLVCVTVPLSLSSPLQDGGEVKSLLRAPCSLIHSAAGLLPLPLLLLGVPAQPGSRGAGGPHREGSFSPTAPSRSLRKVSGQTLPLRPEPSFRGLCFEPGRSGWEEGLVSR